MLKYINTLDCGFVIFTGRLSHKQMWNKIKTENDELISAGFVMTHISNLECIGKSLSLGVQSKPGDTDNLKHDIIRF